MQPHIMTERRAVRYGSVFQKPRILHYISDGRHVDAEVHEPEARIQADDPLVTDGIQTHRMRFDLFIDLIWIGIVSNISDFFYDQAFQVGSSAGHATTEFTLLFLPAWRIWSTLQAFMSTFYKNDLLQQVLLLYTLILGVIYGNNAPFLLRSADTYATSKDSSYLISTYLLAIYALETCQVVYSIWIPWLRRPMLVAFLLSLPSIGLWITTTLASHDIQIYLFIAAIAYDYVLHVVLNSPLGDVLMWKSGPRMTHNPKYIRERYEGFFMIAIGEGVFLLIKGSVLGAGLNPALGRGILAFLIYYSLHCIYFNADQSRRFVHAVSRTWWTFNLWQLLHIFMFGNLVQLSASLLYLISYDRSSETSSTSEESVLGRRAETISDSYITLRTAACYACVNTGLILLSQTTVALLDECHDTDSTAILRNRYLRLLPRACAGVVLMILWLHDFTATELLGVIASLCWVVLLSESVAGMERKALTLF